MLKWTQSKLAAEAGVGRKTIADFEAGSRTLHRRTRVDITAALQSAGVEFLWDDAQNIEGVRFNDRPPVNPVGTISANLGRE